MGNPEQTGPAVSTVREIERSKLDEWVPMQHASSRCRLKLHEVVVPLKWRLSKRLDRGAMERGGRGISCG
jgi:hypothetical protein